MIKVVCVYRNGGDFTPDYVFRLRSGVARHLKFAHEFICLTDRVGELQKIASVPLAWAWPGWWSKMEIFGIHGPVLYLDLDTVVVGSIDTLAERITESEDELFMVRDFYKQNLLSTGMLGWNGDVKWILDEFRKVVDGARWSTFKGTFYLGTASGSFRGDQEWLRPILSGQDEMKVSSIQDVFSGIRSYKVHMRNCRQLIGDERVICFHGKPRPHEVRNVPWMKKHWCDSVETLDESEERSK